MYLEKLRHVLAEPFTNHMPSIINNLYSSQIEWMEIAGTHMHGKENKKKTLLDIREKEIKSNNARRSE